MKLFSALSIALTCLALTSVCSHYAAMPTTNCHAESHTDNSAAERSVMESINSSRVLLHTERSEPSSYAVIGAQYQLRIACAMNQAACQTVCSHVRDISVRLRDWNRNRESSVWEALYWKFNARQVCSEGGAQVAEADVFDGANDPIYGGMDYDGSYIQGMGVYDPYVGHSDEPVHHTVRTNPTEIEQIFDHANEQFTSSNNRRNAGVTLSSFFGAVRRACALNTSACMTACNNRGSMRVRRHQWNTWVSYEADVMEREVSGGRRGAFNRSNEITWEPDVDVLCAANGAQE